MSINIKKVGIGALAVTVIGLAGYGGYNMFSGTKNSTSESSLVQTGKLTSRLENSNHSDTLNKTLDTSNKDSIINGAAEAKGDLTEEDIVAYNETTGTAGLAAQEMFSVLASYETKTDAELKKDVTVDQLNNLAYWFVWYSKLPQLVSSTGSIDTADNGLDRLALVYERLDTVSPYDVYANGFKITTDEWDSFKPKDFDSKVEQYRKDSGSVINNPLTDDSTGASSESSE